MSIQRQTISSEVKTQNDNQVQSATKSVTLTTPTNDNADDVATDAVVRPRSEFCNANVIPTNESSKTGIAESATSKVPGNADAEVILAADGEENEGEVVDDTASVATDMAESLQNSRADIPTDNQMIKPTSGDDSGKTEDNDAVQRNTEGVPTVETDRVSARPIYTQEQLDRLIEEAYLRGRNEAIEARIGSDSRMRRDESLRNSTFAPYIVGRPSVWK